MIASVLSVQTHQCFAMASDRFTNVFFSFSSQFVTKVRSSATMHCGACCCRSQVHAFRGSKVHYKRLYI